MVKPFTEITEEEEGRDMKKANFTCTISERYHNCNILISAVRDVVIPSVEGAEGGGPVTGLLVSMSAIKVA